MNPYPEVTSEEQKKKNLVADLVGAPVARPAISPFKEANKKIQIKSILPIKNPLKPSKYVFRSKGLPTDMTTSINRQKLVMASILEQAARQIQQQRIIQQRQKQEQMNLQQQEIKQRQTQHKPQINKTSLAYQAKNEPLVGQVKTQPPAKRPTYVKTTVNMGKPVTW
jgi:hypothetical protein